MRPRWEGSDDLPLAVKQGSGKMPSDIGGGPRVFVAHVAQRLPRRVSRLILPLLALLCIIGLLGSALVITLFPRRPIMGFHSTVEVNFPQASRQEIETGSRKLVILLPADKPNPDLCKVIISAVGMGYPVPVILNWAGNKTDHETGHIVEHISGRHDGQLRKISGTLNYLDASTRHDAPASVKLSDNDIVVALDAYDVWFQLPPQVLMQRFHATNNAANRRLKEQWGGEDEHMPMQQTIIISAQKGPWPDKAGFNLHVDDIPESPLPADLYGDKTDTAGEDYHWMRPRFVNSGSVMGPVGDMKRFYRRVQERMDRAFAEGWEAQGGDQGVFAEIFGEQEVWRRLRRDQRRAGSNVAETQGAGLIQENFEYHVGIDYVQDMFFPTVYTGNDGDFIVLNDSGLIESESKNRGVVPARLQGVPSDVASVRNPLADVETGLGDSALGWEGMALFSNFVTATVPVVLHHNAHRHGVKARRKWWWDRTWYFPYMRELVAANRKPGPGPVASIPAREGQLEYWSLTPGSNEPKWFSSPSGMSPSLEDAAFDAVCKTPDETAESAKHWWDEVFRDGKGPL